MAEEKKTYEDMSNPEKIDAKKRKIKKLFRDLPTEKKQFAEGLINQFAVTSVTLERLADAINNGDLIEDFVQGAQKMRRESPALRAYNTTIKSFSTLTNQLTGKWCPRPWMGDDTNTYYGTSGNEQWKKFKERLSGEELDMNIEEARKQLTSCADTGDTPSAWARDAAEFCKRKGIFNGDGAGNYGWQQPITREAVAQILYNAFESAGMLDAIPDKK